MLQKHHDRDKSATKLISQLTNQLINGIIESMTEIFLTNTLTRKKEKFVPIDAKKVGIYSCGPTVYRDIHIGNLRTYLAADILRRVLTYSGYKVFQVKNITDVGHMRTDPTSPKLRGAGEVAAYDPIIAEALKTGKTPQEIAAEYTKKFLEDEKKLNILPAEAFPKATEHIQEMVELTKTLLEKGYAYPSTRSARSGQASGTILDAEGGAKRGKAGIRGEDDDRSFGAVYFDVKKFANYGKLSGNTLEKMDKLLEAVRVATETDKKDSADFALWKKAEEGRSLKWSSPWGEGFPGWHIECSAMALKHLGDTFDGDKFYGERSRTIDIHTGGEDNIFPHHEDEIAQSEAATGKKFVNYWLHGGYLLVDGKKMARREGNVHTVADIIKKGFDPLAFRYLCLTSHYRSRLNFTWDSLKAAESALNNLYREITGYAVDGKPMSARLRQGYGGQGCGDCERKFLEAVNNDMDLPSALSVVWELVKSNKPTSTKLATLYKFDQVLGLDLEKVTAEAVKVPGEVSMLVKKREESRTKGDFVQADKLRKEIAEKGYEVVDEKAGPRLKRLIEKK